MADLEISVLTKQTATTRLGELREVDGDVGWMSWGDDAYLADLPRKWELSRIGEIDGVVVGYALCSAKEQILWLHRIVTAPDCRGTGTGGAFLRELEHAALEHNYTKIGLKTPVENRSSIKFYRSNGYSEISREGEYLVMEKAIGRTVVGVHQPNFIPWLGYFYKVCRSDVFVILDDVLAPSRGYFNRSKVLVQGDGRWLTVPVHRGDGYIHRMEVAESGWVQKHLGTLQHHYQKAPFYKELMPEVTSIISDYSVGKLADLNLRLIQHINSLLRISTPMVKSSEFDLSTSGDERLVDLVQKVEGTTYLSGRGGDNYQAAETFESGGIDLVYTGFENSEYTQQGGRAFVGGLSALDALFNIGPDETRRLIDDAPDPVA